MLRIDDVMSGREDDYAEIYRLAREHGHDADLCLLRISVWNSQTGGHNIEPCYGVAELFLRKSEPRA